MTRLRCAAAVAAGMTLLLIGSLFSPPAVYVCLAVGVCALPFLGHTALFSLLLYLMPYAVLFKASPGSTSFFTLLELWALALLALRVRSIDRRVLAALCVLLMALAPVSCRSASLWKILVNLLLLYAFVRGYRAQDAVWYGGSFAAGLLASSVLGLWKEKIPRFLAMYSDLNYEVIGGVRTLRFSGTFNDPNYFSVMLILGILLCIRGLQAPGRGQRTLCAFALLALAGLGMATYSKSFALMLPVALLTLLTLRARRKWALAALLAAVCALVWALDPGGVIGRLLARFSQQSLSTGRAAIWRSYWQGATDALLPFLFGHGLDAQLARPAHSLLLEALYAVGLVGTVCWLSAIAVILHTGAPCARGRWWGMGYAAVFVMYGFLTGLTDYALPFALMMAYMFSRTGAEEVRMA